MSIRIVTHCYAKKLPQYAKFLCFQLSSLICNRPKVPTTISVCYTTDDSKTCDVLDVFTRRLDIDLRLVPMSPAALFRRSIGRNHVALGATEELVWFCDVDHVFGEGCLDSLWEIWKQFEEPKPIMIYPKTIQIHKTHALGDAVCNELDLESINSQLAACDTSEESFEELKYNRPIGGVQIVQGAYCRQYGYLNHASKWQTQRSDGVAFGDFRDDVAFKNHVKAHGPITRIELAGLFRLRHSLTTYQ